jgi:hypothetical protein
MLKRLNGRIWGMLALALIFSGVTLSAQTAAPAPKKAPATTAAKTTAKKAPAATEKTATGTITSIDATHLVMSHMVKGKSEQMTLVLTPATKRDASLAAGGKVSVRYHTENSDQVASSVRSVAATTAKAKTSTKAPAAKKAS